jgi:hypothetical protein
VFLLCLSSFCVPYVPSFSGYSILIALRYSLTFIETTKFRFIFDRCFTIFYIHKSIINIMKFNFFVNIKKTGTETLTWNQLNIATKFRYSCSTIFVCYWIISSGIYICKSVCLLKFYTCLLSVCVNTCRWMLFD